MRKFNILLLILLFCLPVLIQANQSTPLNIKPIINIDYADWDMCSETGLKNLLKVMQSNPSYTVKLNEVICGASSIKRYLTRKGIASRRIRISGIASCSCYGTASDGSTQCALSDFIVYDGKKTVIDFFTLEQQL